MNSKSNKIEDYLKGKILLELERGRPDFDKPHTLAVVYWLKQIIKHSSDLKLDENVLLISAYAHDWGYADMFSLGQQLQYSDVINAKAEHMVLGAKN
jgi:hypothetical protein